MSADYVCQVLCFIKKIASRQSWRVCLIQRQISPYFRRPVWKTNSW